MKHRSRSQRVKDFELFIGDSKVLSVIYNPDNTTDSRDVAWTTSDATVATVENGKVTALKVGTAVITATVTTNQSPPNMDDPESWPEMGKTTPSSSTSGNVQTQVNSVEGEKKEVSTRKGKFRYTDNIIFLVHIIGTYNPICIFTINLQVENMFSGSILFLVALSTLFELFDVISGESPLSFSYTYF